MPAYVSCDLLDEGTVAWLTLSAPHKRNALSSELVDELDKWLGKLENTLALKALVISGTEEFFSAGVDLSEIAATTTEQATARLFLGPCWRKLSSFPLPTVAAVTGYALGGGFELALMCDMILATEEAKFGLPEVTLGLMPGLGGTQRLARLMGPHRAAEICLTGRILSAEEALRSGIIAGFLKKASLREDVLSFVRKFTLHPRTSLQLVKKAIALNAEVPLSAGLELERLMFLSALSTQEKEARTKRFLPPERQKEDDRSGTLR